MGETCTECGDPMPHGAMIELAATWWPTGAEAQSLCGPACAEIILGRWHEHVTTLPRASIVSEGD